MMILPAIYIERAPIKRLLRLSYFNGALHVQVRG